MERNYRHHNTDIRQVAALLGYGEPQVSEVFKNTLPSRFYWVLFPIEDLRQVVETAKKYLLRKNRLTTCRPIILYSIHEDKGRL